MNLDNLLLRLQALRERVGEMQADRSEALPQAYLPELTATTIAEVSTALSELQSELRGVSDRWQLATSTLNSIIYDWDINRRTVDRTQGLCNVLGYRPEEVLPTLDWWTSRIHPDDKERVRNEVRNTLATQTEFGIEYRILNKDESYRYVWDRGLIVRNASGEAVRVVGSTLDITERKLAEAARHKSQELLRTVVTNAPVVLYVLDKEGVFTLSEGKGLEGLGKKPGQSVGHSVFDLYRNYPEIGENIRRALAGKQVTWISHIGEVVFNNLVTPLRDETGQVTCLVGVATEITKLQRAEMARKESERRFRAIFNNTFQLTGLLTPEGILLEVNQAALDFIGSEADVVIGQPFWEMPWWNFSPTIQQQLQAAITRVAAGEFVRYEVEIPGADGCLHAFDFSLKPIKDDTGQVVLLIPEGRDITEIKQTQAALIESEARLQAILDYSPVSVYLKDLQGRYLLINPESERLSGFSQEQLIGKTDYEILPTVVAEQLRANDQQVLDTLTPLVREEVLPTEDGQCTYITVKFPLFDAKGIPNAICGISTDITERKRAEEQIRFQARLLDVVEQAIVTTDLNGTITYWNRFAENLYGWQSVEVMGRNILEVTPAEVSKPLFAEILSRLQRGESWYGEFLVQRRDGTTFPAMVSDVPIFDRDGVLIGIVSVTSEITQLKLAEAALRQANQELELRVQERTTTLSETNRKLEAEIAERKQTEAALRRSEERFRTSIENMLDCFGIYTSIRDQSGRIVDFRTEYVNAAACENNQMTKEQMIGKGLCELLPNHRDTALFDEYVRVIETGVPLSKEDLIYEDVYGAGVCINRAFDIRLAKLGDGFVATWRDITNRKQAEEALARREQEFKALVENAPDVIARYDRELRHVYVNPAVEIATGLPPKAFIGRTNLELGMSEDAVSIWCQTLQTVFETGCEQEFEFEFLTPNGLKYYQSRLVPEFAQDGTTETILNISRDVTERKLAQSALQESEERFRSLSACSPVGIFETDLAGRCLYTNPRYQEICGCTLEESLGEGWSRFVHPEDRDRVFAAWSLYAREGREYSDEFRLQTQEGIVRWVHARSLPMFSAQGELIGHVGTVEDITSRRQAEAKILAALHQERELSELRNSFLSLVSHEFRTPLTTIRSSAELLDRYKNRLSDEKKQTHHQRIQSAVDRMTQLLDEVLLIGQAEAGKLKFEPQPLDLVSWCRDLVEGMQVVVENAHLHKSHQHAIAFTSSSECADVQMDEKLLGHILTNLLSNAIKYSPEGGTVQFDLVCTAREAIFRITDSGIGIPAEYLPQLFESFQRASNVGTIQGTGLGLAIVKKAVDLHRGKIAVESEVGVGTTFTVRLPFS